MKKSLVLAAVLALTLALGLPELTLAQTTDGEVPPPVQNAPEAAPGENNQATTLDTVVVTAGRRNEDIRRVTAAMTVIPEEELNKTQYRNLGDILKNYGLQVNSFSQTNALSQLRIRGISSSAMGNDLQGAILILVDGRRVGTDNVGLIPLVNVERIEIIKGPAAVQYGTSAIGGVVNVITKRGKEDVSAYAEVGLGSWDAYTIQGGVSGQWSVIDFAGAARYNSQDQDYTTGKRQKYDNTGYNFARDYSLNLGLNFYPEHRLGLTMLGTTRNDMGSPGDLTWPSESDYNDRSNYSWDALYEGGYKDYALSWMARYYHGNTFYLNDNHDAPGAWSYFQSQTQYQGSQVQASKELGPLTLTGGWDWMKYNTSQFGYGDSYKQASEYRNMAGFLLANLGLFDDLLVITGGLRYDEYKLSLDDSSDHMHRTTPSIGLAVHPIDWLSLRANYGESYRIPDAVQLLGFEGGGWATYLPNPDLKPEKGRSWDVGFETNPAPLSFGLTYFETYYRDKIISRTVGGDYQYYNLTSDVTYRGLEGKFGYDIGQAMDWPFRLRPYLFMTWMFKYKSDDGEVVPNVSNLDLAYGLEFDYPDIGLNADLRFTYFGRQYQDEFDPVTYETRQVKTGGDTTVDFFISKTLYTWENAGAISIKAEVRNIFDHYYESTINYPMPGRSFYVGLRYDF